MAAPTAPDFSVQRAGISNETAYIVAGPFTNDIRMIRAEIHYAVDAASTLRFSPALTSAPSAAAANHARARPLIQTSNTRLNTLPAHELILAAAEAAVIQYPAQRIIDTASTFLIVAVQTTSATAVLSVLAKALFSPTATVAQTAIIAPTGGAPATPPGVPGT